MTFYIITLSLSVVYGYKCTRYHTYVTHYGHSSRAVASLLLRQCSCVTCLLGRDDSSIPYLHTYHIRACVFCSPPHPSYVSLLLLLLYQAYMVLLMLT